MRAEAPGEDETPGTGLWRRAAAGPARGARRLRTLRDLGGMGLLAGFLVALIVLPTACTAGVGARDAARWLQDEPAGLADAEVPQRSRILAADGSTLATFFYQNRVSVPLDEIAPVARRAVLAIEDSRFYEHGALDTQGTIRALLANLDSGEVVQGGSGITQQYVKNLLLIQADTRDEERAATEVTAARKLRELRYALALEQNLTKDEILTRYLNIAYFGAGAYGIEAASRRFFSKHAHQLVLREAALLAGMIRYPEAYDPLRHPARARERRNVVIDRMEQLGWVDPARAAAESRRGLTLDPRATANGCVSSSAPFFCDYVQREILTDPAFGDTRAAREALLKRGGLTIRTTLDRRTQKAARTAVKRYVPYKNRAHLAAAEVLVEPGTGKIKGMVVGRELGDGDQRGKTWINFAADASHGSSIGMQAGSTFKVFTLAAALDEGMPFGTRFTAPRHFVPTGFENCAGEPVGDTEPLGNAADGEGGRSFSLLTGTHHSVNTFFLKLERKVGLCDTAKMAARLGMRKADGGPLEQYPSFTLGFNQVSPLRLAAAYAAFGARGTYCEPVAITEVTDRHGENLDVPGADCRRVVGKGVADAVNHVLSGVLTKGTARGSAIGRPAAGKTGTVDNFSAAWFAGHTPDLAAAVWVGDPRGGYEHPMDNVCLDGRCYGAVYGASIPAPIWEASMRGALAATPATPFHRPPRHYFSKGSGLDLVRLPDVRGMKVGKARAKLRAAGFDVVVGDEVRSGRDKGRVARMSPGPGAVEPGITVTLRPSGGKKDRDDGGDLERTRPDPPAQPGDGQGGEQGG